jgi:hypothetical protein
MDKLSTLQLIEVTSQTQANNGTVSYYDPIKNCYYNLYESGYVRRTYKTKSWRGYTINVCYQLNPTKATKTQYGTSTVRIMLNTHEQRINQVIKNVIAYRKTK